MTIVAQNRSLLINYDNVVAVNICGNYIHVYTTGNTNNFAIAEYNSEEDAFAVLMDMAESFSGRAYINPINNLGLAEERYDVYIMPEKNDVHHKD